MLTTALAEKRKIRVRYRSYSDDDEFSTLLQPYRIVFLKRSWYVIARSSLHAEVRTFNIARVDEAEPTEDPYVIPSDFHLDTYFGNAWEMIREPGVSHDVTVRFAPLVARNVAEVNWHRTQTVVWNGDGSINFSVTLDSLMEVVWWILGYGREAEVLQPPELRELVRSHVQRMHDIYDGADS